MKYVIVFLSWITTGDGDPQKHELAKFNTWSGCETAKLMAEITVLRQKVKGREFACVLRPRGDLI